MIWAKVINDEVVQTFDEDPSAYWHPEALKDWKQVPDNVFIGWKYKNGKWISGAQWLEEFQAENPVPPPGPPSAGIMNYIRDTDNTGIVELVAILSGIYTEFEWEVNGKKYNTETVSVEIEKGEGPITVPVSLTVTGPGGSFTKVLEDEEAIVVRPKTRPLPKLA